MNFYVNMICMFDNVNNDASVTNNMHIHHWTGIRGRGEW